MSERISNANRKSFYEEILESGFIIDDLIVNNIDKEVYGVNVTCAWPLPTEIRENYEKLYAIMNEIEDVYVYPYSQTHITILTLINFKKRLNQPPKRLDSESLEQITSVIKEVINEKKITLSFDTPVLVRAAAFLPINNPTKEILDIRERIIQLPDVNRKYSLDIPKAIHSTILRFKKLPDDPQNFIDRFEKLSRTFSPCEGTIEEVFITEELKPYMRGGIILQTISN